MRKILSAALALVCVWFASPALADLDPCRNLFDGVWQSGIYSTTTGVYSSAENRVSNKNMIAVQPDTKYVASGDGVNAIRWLFYDSNKAFIRAVSGNQTITTPNGTKYINFYIAADYTVETAPRFQIEQGDTATEYVPYNPLCATCNGTVVNYVSATGTGVQNGTPTPTNPIEPTFYTQGDMILRAVGSGENLVADSYDASTGKITRRVGVKVLDGTEDWIVQNGTYPYFRWNTGSISSADQASSISLSSHFLEKNISVSNTEQGFSVWHWNQNNVDVVSIRMDDTYVASAGTLDNFKQWLAAQYAARTPVTIYYPLATEVEEDWPASQCTTDPIKIATTKYNETAFGPLNTALANAISVVDTVVSNTITQAASIATLQTQKQTRPNDIADDSEKCPAGKKCLLVEDASGTPHWYEIVERYSILPDGYTELQYITFNATQSLDTGFTPNQDSEIRIKYSTNTIDSWVYGTGSSNPRITLYSSNAGNQRFGNVYVSSVNIYGSRGAIHTDIQNKSGLNHDGTLLNYNGSVGTFTAERTLTIGTSHNDTSSTHKFDGSVYYLQIYNNNVMVRDYVPAQDSNNNVGLFDRVNNVFLTAEGLVAGAIVE